MPQDDEAARKSRADDLRKQIASLTHPQKDAGAETDAAAAREKPHGGGGVSPRDFINEKMHELDDPATGTETPPK
jgi:hypothetical protein